MASKVNIFKSGSEWCFAAWVDGEYDTAGTLLAETEAEARAEVLECYPGAAVELFSSTVAS